MKEIKSRWEITKNWQLIYPFVGLVVLAYSAFRISNALTGQYGYFIIVPVAIVLFIFLLKFTLFLFKKLEKKWILDAKWEMIRVFIVFAITGSSSLFVGRPIISWLGITQENLHPMLYWILFIVIGLIFYQILLVFFGWLFGQHEFFWNFEKKMLRRIGLIKDKN